MQASILVATSMPSFVYCHHVHFTCIKTANMSYDMPFCHIEIHQITCYIVKDEFPIYSKVLDTETMAKETIFQRLNKVFSHGKPYANNEYKTNTYGTDSDIIFRTKDKARYDQMKLQKQQQSLLARQWVKAKYDIQNNSLAGLNNVKLMYRDADLMDAFPEIGAALDIVSEESVPLSDEGFVLNITSKSDRIKSILQDLFINRLSINTTLPMICRATCKYGNDFMLLNIDEQNGILGWKQLPVYDMERYENGMNNPYSAAYTSLSTVNPDQEMSTKFVWVGENNYIPYRNWQVAHFRLLYDSMFLPYGVSFLQKARRHFRMLSMMEDMMLIYRLERSVERRVFKINVGAIDEKDVPAYVQEIANNFKRTPIIDPETGQIDLRKNVLNMMDDFFIPVRDDNAPNPIETLQAAQNLSAMDDIKFIQNKVFTALRVPKAFLNFEEAQGDGKNLSLLDVRFTRTVNRIQQALIMELNKVAMIHLYLLGFTDELTNFNLTMNNPSSQAELLELDSMAKKVATAKDAISDAGNGIPLMSVSNAWRRILKWSDKEIQDNLEELRLEAALAAELQQTSQIIRRTKVFDPVDNIYGEPGADYQQMQQGASPDAGGAAGGGGMPSSGGSAPMGGDLDFGGGGPDETGTEGDMGMDQAASESGGAPAPDNGGETTAPPTENLFTRKGKDMLSEMQEMNKRRKEKVLHDMQEKSKHYSELLLRKIHESRKKPKENMNDLDDNGELERMTGKAFLVNEELNDVANQLKEYTDKAKDGKKVL